MSGVSESKHLSMQGIKARGWTDALIRDFLGDPDKLVKNPHYRTAPPCKLYTRARVERTERCPRFKARMEKIVAQRPARRKAAQARADRERQELLALVEATPIRIRKKENLTKRAIQHYNSFRKYHKSGDLRMEFVPAAEHSDPDFLYRITCNYVRHELTDYDQFLYSQVRSKTGCEEAYQRFRERVDEEVRQYVDRETAMSFARTAGAREVGAPLS